LAGLGDVPRRGWGGQWQACIRVAISREGVGAKDLAMFINLGEPAVGAESHPG